MAELSGSEKWIRKISAMKVPFRFETAQFKADEEALIDSGATDNFIDEVTWKRLRIGRTSLKEPLLLHNVDGTENRQGQLTHFCWLRIRHDGRERLMKFYITSLGRDCILLGYPFLKRYNPTINWKKGTMEGELVIQSAAYKYLGKYVAKTIRRVIRQVG